MRQVYSDYIARVDPLRFAVNDCLTYGTLARLIQDGSSEGSSFGGSPFVRETIARIVGLFHRNGTFDDGNPMFVAQTSGSTGVPKTIGVAAHVFLPCLEHWMEEGIIVSSDRVLLVHAHTFDPWMLDVLASLSVGACLLVPPSPPVDYVALCDFCNSFKPTVLHCTPSFLLRIPVDARAGLLTTISRQVGTGGEPPVSWEVLVGKATWRVGKYLSFYGTTELSVWSTVNTLDGSNLTLIGLPIKGTKVWLTPESHIAMSRGGLEIVTSDLGRRIADGGGEDIEFVGRADRVRKRFGKAFSLDELERVVVASYPSCVRRAHVELVDEIDVVCFVELKDDAAVQLKVLKHSLKRVLPARAYLILLEHSFPTNVHGKLSRQDLLRFYEEWLGVKRLRFRGRSRLLRRWLSRLPVQQGLLLEQVDSVTVHVIAREFSRLSGTADNVSMFLYTPVENLEKKCTEAMAALPVNQEAVPIHPVIAQHPATIWQVATGKCVDAAPIFIFGAGTPLICVPCHDGFVYFVDTATGTLRRTHDLGDRLEVAAVPESQKSSVWCGTRGGCVMQIGLPDLEIRSFFSVNGSCKGICVAGGAVVVCSESGLWVFRETAVECLSELSFLCAPRLSPDGSRLVAVASTGRVLCFSVSRLSLELSWEAFLTAKRPARHVFLSSATFRGDDVWIASVSTLFHLNYRGVVGEAPFHLPMQCFRSPALFGNDCVIVGGGRTLVFITCSDGGQETVTLPYNVSSGPIVSESSGFIAFGTLCGRVLVLKRTQIILDALVCPSSFPIFSDPLWEHNDCLYVGTRANSLVKLSVVVSAK